jgi:hypothetical protein
MFQVRKEPTVIRPAKACPGAHKKLDERLRRFGQTLQKLWAAGTKNTQVWPARPIGRFEKPLRTQSSASWGSIKPHPATGGVPWVWNDSMVFSPQACPFLRSSSVHTIGFQSGARMRRAPALATSTRLPPGS